MEKVVLNYLELKLMNQIVGVSRLIAGKLMLVRGMTSTMTSA